MRILKRISTIIVYAIIFFLLLAALESLYYCLFLQKRIGKTDFYFYDAEIPIGVKRKSSFFSNTGRIYFLRTIIKDAFWDEKYVIARSFDKASDTLYAFCIIRYHPDLMNDVIIEIDGGYDVFVNELSKRQIDTLKMGYVYWRRSK